MRRDVLVELRCYTDVPGGSPDLPFDPAHRAAILTELRGLYTPGSGDTAGDVFDMQCHFGLDLPGSSQPRIDVDLLADLEALRLSPPPPGLPAGGWRLWILIARSTQHQARPFGVLLDTARRSGAAVFVNSMTESLFPLRELLVRTIAHEIGHALNLTHEDAAGDNTQILFDPTADAGLPAPPFSSACWTHLLRHVQTSVAPGGTPFGTRTCPDHLPSAASVFASANTRRKVSLHLQVTPGRVRRGRVPTFVIGEPVHLALLARNRSRRPVYVAADAETRRQTMVVLRRGGPIDDCELLPPLVQCAPRARWLRVEPGATARFQETLFSRQGTLVFPRPGRYELQGMLRRRHGWIASPPVEVRVIAPEKPRHYRATEIAADSDLGLFLELGGPIRAAARARLEQLARVNPRFPLRQMAALVEAREEVLAPGPTPAGQLRRLTRLKSSPGVARPLRREADLLLCLEHGRAGDERSRRSLRRRLSDPSDAPVAAETTARIRNCIEQAVGDAAEETEP